MLPALEGHALGLVLFDIDATLISTSRSGIRAMRLAGRELYDPAFEVAAIEFDGNLDQRIIAAILRHVGREVTPAGIGAFRAAYARHLGAVLADRATIATALPGVMDLLERLARVQGLTLGLLTGNFPETGQMKLRACGIDPARFAVHVWADDATGQPPTRDELPAVALRRWQGPAERTVVIGDTPHDVRCAKVNGCRSIAVATGSYEAEALAGYEPCLTVEDLSDTDQIEGVIRRWCGV
jgi:phosphoglycolate phosphatase